MLSRYVQTGFTLTELMIGSTVGLIVLAGAVQLYTINIRASNDNLQLARLSHDSRSLLALMQRDLMRSGYWFYSPETTSSQNNPFTQQTEYLHIGAKADEADASCILYSYDRYKDGLIGVGSTGTASATTTTNNMEQYGFRLSEGRLQMRQGGADYACDAGRWQTMNEPSITIDNVTFNLASSCVHASNADSSCVVGEPAWQHARLNIQLTASLAHQPEVTLTQSTTINIRNDQWIAAW